jgi:HEAT repeat protein
MFAMKTNTDGKPPGHGSYRAGMAMIVLTSGACVAALVFRTPIRSRYWAWQVIQAHSVAERVAPLTCLCNAGDAGRWGAAALLAHPDEEIRQYGVVVLQHAESDWSRRALLQALRDSSESVREMAALGLAVRGDDTVIPELLRIYADGDDPSARAACLALERLATPAAVAALTGLTREPADAARRAALADALAAIGSENCVPGLLELLDDGRPCGVETRAERVLARLAPLLAERGLSEPATSRPASAPVTQTVAERAAAALAQITGLSPPFAPDLTVEQRNEAVRVWSDWLAARRASP